MAPHTEAAAPTDSNYVSIPFLTCAVCRAIIEANASDASAGHAAAACDKGQNKHYGSAVANLPVGSLASLARLLATAHHSRHSVQNLLQDNEYTLFAVATDLYHELLAASAVISEMTSNMTAPQRHVTSNNLYEAGLIGASGGMTRAAERHKVLAAAEAAGLK